MHQMHIFDEDNKFNCVCNKLTNKTDGNRFIFDQKLCFELSTMFVDYLVSANPLANVSENLTLVLSIA